MLMTFPRHFTVAEANQALPQVRAAIEVLRTLNVSLFEAYERLAQASGGNGHSSAADAYREGQEKAITILQELVEQGIQVKDIEEGLVDFPHLRRGREVFLCWKMGEAAVCYWHDPGAGCHTRRPL